LNGKFSVNFYQFGLFGVHAVSPANAKESVNWPVEGEKISKLAALTRG
jgi:hypothetical protein